MSYFFYRKDFIKFNIFNHCLSRYLLKPSNNSIKTYFQMSPQLTKEEQKWVYSYYSLLYLKMFHSLLSYLSHWFRTFICLLESLLEEPKRLVRIIFEECLWDTLFLQVADIRACKIYDIWIFKAIQWISFKKSLLVFFRKHHWNMLKRNTYFKILVVVKSIWNFRMKHKSK